MSLQLQSQMIRSERQRTLQGLDYAESAILSRDLPRDTILKALDVRLSGSVVTTFASGTPVADAQSTMDNLVSSFLIQVNGSRTIKSVRPHMLHMIELLAFQTEGERKGSAAAAAATLNNPTTDGGFVYGTTTQVSTAAESCTIFFEHVLAQIGREGTWLNLKGATSAFITINTKAFSSLLGFGNTAPVVFTTSTFRFDFRTLEAQDIDPRTIFADFRQTLSQFTYSSQQTSRREDLQRGNFLSGILFYCRDGAAGSATTATGKLASDKVLDTITVWLNGQLQVKSTTFFQLQAQNRRIRGINAARASGVSRFDGVAFYDFLQNGDLSTALNVQPPQVDNVQVEMATQAAASVSYTNPVEVNMDQHEIVPGVR